MNDFDKHLGLLATLIFLSLCPICKQVTYYSFNTHRDIVENREEMKIFFKEKKKTNASKHCTMCKLNMGIKLSWALDKR